MHSNNYYSDKEFYKLWRAVNKRFGTGFIVSQDEGELIQDLIEACFQLTDLENLETAFFMACDVLGLDEEFKQRVFFDRG